VLRGVGVAEEVRDIRDATPEWIDDETGELRDGVHSLRAKRAEPTPEPVEAQVMPAEPTPEPVAEKRAEPATEKPAAVMQAAPAEEPRQEQRSPAKGAQGKLGW
jgi:outer membrane biosynthesis protein TonB